VARSQHTCDTLQHTATHCNTLQHTILCVSRDTRRPHVNCALRIFLVVCVMCWAGAVVVVRRVRHVFGRVFMATCLIVRGVKMPVILCVVCVVC